MLIMGWKDPPADSAKLWLNKSLEIQTNLACNWSCVSCDQGSQFSSIQWVKKGTLSLDQIAHFCGEMRQHNAYFGRLRLVGGEPTIHKHFADLVEMLYAELVLTGHSAGIEVVTNGTHPERIAPVKEFIQRVRVSGDGDKQKHHVANLIHSPASLGYEGKPCSSPWHCGISLNYYGYFPCSAGAGIARFEDWMKWQRLTLPLCVKPCNAVWENWPDLKDLCGHCYHGLKSEHKIKSGTSDPLRNQPGEHIKPALDAWLGGKMPTWPIYGAPACGVPA
jgi:hypothetical protein